MKNTSIEIKLEAFEYDAWLKDLISCPRILQIPWIYKTLKSKKNLHIFGKYFFPHIIQGRGEVPQCHIDLLKELAKREDGAIIFPRGHAKSTWVKIDLIHDIVYHIEDVILYVGSTFSDAGHQFEAIKAELENNSLLVRVYGDMVPSSRMVGRKWTSKHFQTRNGVNVVARGRSKGRGVNIKNKRPTKIIIDDAEDDEQVRSIEQRLKFHDWLYNVVFPSLDREKGYIKMVGTVLHEMAEVKLFYQKHGGIFRRAIEDGVPIWPKYWSLERLEAQRIRIGTRAFNREYLNNPTADDEAMINPKWIQKGEYVLLPQENSYEAIMHIDPQAGESAKADEYAISCVYFAKRTVHRYVVEQVAGRATQMEQVRNVVRMWLRHKPVVRVVGIEKVLNQTSIWQLLCDWKAGNVSLNTPDTLPEDIVDEGNRNIPIMEWSPQGKDKVARLQMFEPDFERGEIHLRPEMMELKRQLMFTMGVAGEHDDRADSLVAALEIGFNPAAAQRASADTNDDKGNSRYNKTIAGNLLKRQF